jgi:hypothetical protein
VRDFERWGVFAKIAKVKGVSEVSPNTLMVCLGVRLRCLKVHLILKKSISKIKKIKDPKSQKMANSLLAKA